MAGTVTRYLALLRGINVGGRNIIPMADLRACLSDAGFGRVATYIQSGNVLFDAPETRPARLAARIAELLTAAFDYDASLVLLDRAQMQAVGAGAPKGFGTDLARYRCDVLFLMPPVDASAALEQIPTREGVDRTWAGDGVLYFERLAARASQSRLSKIATLPVYKQLTIRNWNTTTKLLALMEE